MKEFTTYHKVLRVSAVVFALMLVFQSGLFTSTTTLIAQNTENYLANAVGMSASVQPTDLNLYTAALTQKEKELAAREAALNEREIAIDLSQTGDNNTATYILASILFILLVLILLNYTLDYLRAREVRQVPAV